MHIRKTAYIYTQISYVFEYIIQFLGDNMGQNNRNDEELEEEYVFDLSEDGADSEISAKFNRGILKDSDIQEVFGLLEIARKSTEKRERITDTDKAQLRMTEFTIPMDLNSIPPLISVDGSYSFLFSFPGAETWIVLFRIAVSHYKIISEGDKLRYKMESPPQIFDKLDVLSFNDSVLSPQPSFYKIAADVAESFRQRKAQIFATNVMLYLEEKTLEKVSGIMKKRILIKDGPLFSFKGLKKKEIYKQIKINCLTNENYFAGISKSTSTHFFNKYYTDDYFLQEYYDELCPNCAFIAVSDEKITDQMKDRFHMFGDIHFSKLNKEAYKWFRIDIGHDKDEKEKLLSYLAAYSKVHLMPGYPIGLIEAHKIAKSVRDFKETYELELLDKLQNLGLQPQDIINGTVDIEGKQFNSFHELLDQLSL